ncbi:CBS domain-containing protein [Fusibacter tunisiensis]|uniref:Acetoin utilization protein AcuB n=1 Tax=Fusibacter tunisiensis TaxID=1008308 RepID=A0ABS2MS84_9FIRM|nr:CBS domain-containing protein [Fusibacter tunisiensis]MBM7562252.1 acetoin utilization protein AcuB [Fusibacter tunisiensis]
MKVRAIMVPVKELTVLKPTDTAKEAVELIDQNGFLSLPVADGKKFVGFLSKQFIYDTFFKEDHPSMEEFLSRPVITFIHNRVEPVTPDLMVEEAADIFFNKNVRFIPVVDANDQFMGIVTQKALFGVITKIYGLKRTKISIYTDDFKGVLSRIAEIISKNDGNIKNIALIDTEVMGLQEISIRLDTKDPDRIVKRLEEKGFKVREYAK